MNVWSIRCSHYYQRAFWAIRGFCRLGLWSLLFLTLGAVCGGVGHFYGFQSGYESGEWAGAQGGVKYALNEAAKLGHGRWVVHPDENGLPSIKFQWRAQERSLHQLPSLKGKGLKRITTEDTDA